MKRILIVEGNLREENQSFTDGGIKTHTESLKDSISYFTDQLDIDVVNPSSDENINEVAKDLTKYHGMIWGGSSLNIYNDTPEIRRQINFMRECQKNIKNIFAILSLVIALTMLAPTFALANTPSKVIVQVNGLVCDFCARALEKVFSKQEEVNTIDVNLDTKNIMIEFNDNQTIAEEKIKELITNSGYDVVKVSYE